MSRSKEHMFTKNGAREVFISKYAESYDLKAAADAAGYTLRYAKSLLNDSEVCAEIERLKNDTQSKLKEKVLEEWASIAFADMGGYLDFSSDCDGRAVISLKDSSVCSDTRAVCELAQASNGTFKLKLYDKENALLQLSKLLGMYDENKSSDEENTISVELKGDIREWAK